MDHLSAAGSSATRNLTTTEPSESLNRRKTVDFRFQRPHATSKSFFFNKPMRAMDSRRDFTSKKVFPGHFSELGEKANSGLPKRYERWGVSIAVFWWCLASSRRWISPAQIRQKSRNILPKFGILIENLPNDSCILTGDFDRFFKRSDRFLIRSFM